MDIHEIAYIEKVNEQNFITFLTYDSLYWSNTHESSNLSGSFYKFVDVVLKFMFQVWTMKDGQTVWEGWLFIMVLEKVKQPINPKAYILSNNVYYVSRYCNF